MEQQVKNQNRDNAINIYAELKEQLKNGEITEIPEDYML